MTDTVYFVGVEDIHFENFGHPSLDTNSAHFRPAWARCALASSGGRGGWGNWWLPEAYGLSLTDFWQTAEYYYVGTILNTDVKPLLIFYSSGVPKLAVYANYGGTLSTPALTFGLYKVNSPDYSSVTLLVNGITGGFPTDTLHKLDLHVDLTGGRFTIYSDGLDSGGGALLDYSGDLSFASPVTGWSWGGSDSQVFWSEIALASCDTRSIVGLRTLVPDAVGHLDQWSGAVSDINEIVNNDTTINETDTADFIQDYHVAGPMPTGLPSDAYVRAVMVGARVASGPTAISVTVRSSTDDAQGSFTTSGAFLNKRHIWSINPDTGQPYTVAQVADANFNIGVKSA